MTEKVKKNVMRAECVPLETAGFICSRIKPVIGFTFSSGTHPARICFIIMALLFLSTAAIFASEEERAYDGTSERTSERVYEKVIAHGGGAYRGYDTTNSVEALNQAIANGYKIIELDMELSTDHKIIMLHD